jgi:hypothetical protein
MRRPLQEQNACAPGPGDHGSPGPREVDGLADRSAITVAFDDGVPVVTAER